MVFTRLDERHLDALREIGNVGMGNAAAALSQLTGQTIHLEVSRVMVTDTASIAEILGDGERMVVGIYLRMLGNAQGNILMVFPGEDAAGILEKLLPGKISRGDSLTELELSALKEVGNILASAYLNALGELLHMPLIPSVPHLCIDRAGTVIDSMLSKFSEVGEVILMLDTEFFSRDERICGRFFLLPTPSSLEVILSALGIDSLRVASE